MVARAEAQSREIERQRQPRYQGERMTFVQRASQALFAWLARNRVVPGGASVPRSAYLGHGVVAK